jgi:hypothetical protein
MYILHKILDTKNKLEEEMTVACLSHPITKVTGWQPSRGAHCLEAELEGFGTFIAQYGQRQPQAFA